MHNNNLNNLIFSSCTVYGSPDSLPVDENAPFKKAEFHMEKQNSYVKKSLKNRRYLVFVSDILIQSAHTKAD